MRFWDSSAIVPLAAEESVSRGCRALLRANPRQVVWYFTRSEAVSALFRRHRQGALDDQELRAAERRLERLSGRWTEVDGVGAVRELAERLLRFHPLTAADTLQLAAALVAVDGRPRGQVFVSLDEALLAAAQREGFDPVRPTE